MFVVVIALSASWTAGLTLADWLGLDGVVSWVVIGVTCIAGYFAIGMAYGLSYSLYATTCNIGRWFG